MNVKRFSARSSRDALSLVREAFGEDAVVLSTRPCADGVEVLAMAPDAAPAGCRVVLTPCRRPRLARCRRSAAAPPARRCCRCCAGRCCPRRVAAKTLPDAAPAPTTVEQDVNALSMSTLSFQDYVRERMLRRRRAEQQVQADAAQAAGARGAVAAPAPSRPVAACCANAPPPAVPRRRAASRRCTIRRPPRRTPPRCCTRRAAVAQRVPQRRALERRTKSRCRSAHRP